MSRNHRPYWLNLRHRASCHGCGAILNWGARAYYFPLTKTYHCAQGGCGEKQERFQRDQDFDEQQYDNQYHA